MERCSELRGRHVPFGYTTWNRIVLHGSLDRLQRPENRRSCFREVVGASAVRPAVLLRRPAPDRAWVIRAAAAQAMPLRAAPPGQRTEELVAPSDRRSDGATSVVGLQAAVAPGRMFVSDTPRPPPSGGDPNDRLLPPAHQRCLHDDVSLLDPVSGSMRRRVGTFLPVTLAVFLTGHSFLAPELTRQGVGVRKDDHAFLALDDLAALEAVAERASLPLQYRSSIAQVALATDVSFHRTAPLQERFQRASWVPSWAAPTTPPTAASGGVPAAMGARSRPCWIAGTRGSPSCAAPPKPRSSSRTSRATASCAPSPA